MVTPEPAVLVVVGVEADGTIGRRGRWWIDGADVLLGGPRHLALVPEVDGQVRRAWPSPLVEGLPGLLEEYAGRRIVALASGDPLVSGVAGTLVRLGVRVVVEPATSSVALARARMSWPEDTHATVSLVGRDPALVLRELAPGRRILVLSADASTPERVGDLLLAAGAAGSRLTVLSDLGTDDEGVLCLTADLGEADDPDDLDWADEAGPLHVLAVEVAGAAVSSWASGLPDDAYEHDGQLTKRDVRAAALARLAPAPGQLLWDVGAGAGSVGIEWLRAHPTCRAVAVEADPARAARVGRNAAALGVPGLVVVTGRAPEAVADLEPPDAVFVGGGATEPGLLDACRAVLRPGGRLVVHGVTLETGALLAAAYAEHGGELVRLSVETAAPLGGFTGWTPARAVTQWTWTR